MRGLTSLFLGIFATFAFSWAGLGLVPNFQIGKLEPQSDEDGTDVYPLPQSGMAERGRKIYAANGCFYCHTQQVRPESDSTDIERKWGDRRSAPRDYIYGRPDSLGEMRIGPDLSNIGKRAPADDQTAAAPAPAAGTTAAAAAPAVSGSPAANAPAPPSPPAAAAGSNSATSVDSSVSSEGGPLPYSAAWHHQHLYAPRSINRDFAMPAYAFLYEKRRISGQRSVDALALTGPDAPPTGWEIVPTYDATCLVAYLMSLDQSHPLKEVKSNAPPAAGKGSHEMSDAFSNVRQGTDYSESSDVQQVHAAIQREKREPRVGLEPLSMWLIAVYGLALFFGGAYLGRFSGNFSGDSLDVSLMPSARAKGPGGPGEPTAVLTPAERGKKIFSANCATCHQASGEGVAGQYPPLAGSEFTNGGSRRAAMIVLKGLQGPVKVKGQMYGSAVMQPWDKTFTDQKIADVLTYERTSWDNHGSPVTAEQIAGLRKELASRSESFVEADILAAPDDDLPGGEPAAPHEASKSAPAPAKPSGQ